jgi:O-antigen ligase
MRLDLPNARTRLLQPFDIGSVRALSLVPLLRRRRLDELAAVGSFIALPFSYSGALVGGAPTGAIAWISLLVVAGGLALSRPVDQRAARLLAPFLCFIGVEFVALVLVRGSLFQPVQTVVQFLVPVACYLAVWHVSDQVWLHRTVHNLAVMGLAVVTVLSIAHVVGVLPAESLAVRPLVMSNAVLFAVVAMNITSVGGTIVVAVLALFAPLITGGRTGAATLLIMLYFARSINRRRTQRAIVLLLAVVSLVLASQTQAFQERFFHSGSGDITEALQRPERVNTAGRLELWPKLLDECMETPLFGRGPGAGSRLSSEQTGGVLAHPHNDFLRVFCDGGAVGSVMIWSFFVAVIARAVRGRRRRDAGIHSAALMAMVGLLTFAVTDNPLIYTGSFLAPLFTLAAMSDRALVVGDART